MINKLYTALAAGSVDPSFVRIQCAIERKRQEFEIIAPQVNFADVLKWANEDQEGKIFGSILRGLGNAHKAIVRDGNLTPHLYASCGRNICDDNVSIGFAQHLESMARKIRQDCEDS